MSDNLRIWNAVSKTDPRHTKGFKRAGGFQGTAIKPIWLTKRLTEQFGPAGSGWGMGEPKFETVIAGEEILVFCTVSLWYKDAGNGGEHATVYGVGGDKVLGKNKYGPFTNDEAFKASYTDALSNAMKQIGMGADIHMGMFEDEKYVRETTREFASGGHIPGSTPPGEFADEARRDGLTTETRSTYQVTKDRKEIELLNKTALLAIGTSSNRFELKAWWDEHKAGLREKLPEPDFAAIIAAVEAKRDDLPAVAA